MTLACQKLIYLGHAEELWTVKLLAQHVQQHCERRLPKLAPGTAWEIFSRQEIRSHKISYQLGRQGCQKNGRNTQQAGCCASRNTNRIGFLHFPWPETGNDRQDRARPSARSPTLPILRVQAPWNGRGGLGDRTRHWEFISLQLNVSYPPAPARLVLDNRAHGNASPSRNHAQPVRVHAETRA